LIDHIVYEKHHIAYEMILGHNLQNIISISTWPTSWSKTSNRNSSVCSYSVWQIA